MSDAPETIVPTPPPILRIETAQRGVVDDLDAQIDHLCQCLCAEGFAHYAVSQVEGADFEWVWRLINTLTPSQLNCLYSPNGWIHLVFKLRDAIGIDGETPTITIH